jgi:hypothetical protein
VRRSSWSANVLLPWSMCAMIEKLRMNSDFKGGGVQGLGDGESRAEHCKRRAPD